MTEVQRKEFEKAATPLIKWMRENGHPHMTCIVTSVAAELVEGIAIGRWEEKK